MKKRTQIITLGLAGTMLLSLVACGNQTSQEESSVESSSTVVGSSQAASSETSVDEFAWLNTEGTFPVVKEGTEKTLSIYVMQDQASGPIEDTWTYKFLTDQTNINLEFTSFYPDNRDEFIALTLASGDMPDIIIGGKFTPSELVRYGEIEQQFIDLTPYINETYMPNLTALYEQYPEFKDIVTDGNGKTWSYGFIANPYDRGYIARAFINYEWLDQCKLEVPTTLDEFIDAMRAFKQAGLAKYPIGGSNVSAYPFTYIMNALGYAGPTGLANQICLRNGETVLPYADREVFGEFLKIANQLYTEGLIHPDFYTMDANTTKAIMAEGTGFIGESAPYSLVGDAHNDYWAAIPLTSECTTLTPSSTQPVSAVPVLPPARPVCGLAVVPVP